MDFGLKDKAALVLASGSGIGKGVAKEFAREGAKVMLFGRTEKSLQEAQAEIDDATRNRPLYCVGDLTNPADIERAAEEARREFGSIYALVNNSGGPPAGSFTELDDAAWTHAFSLTLLSYVRSIRVVLPMMEKAGRGRIVNNTSSSIKSAIDGLLLSNVFRLGVTGLSKTLARELAPKNILVNVVGPGRIATDRADHLDSLKAMKLGLTKQEVRRQAEKLIPMGRLGSVEEIARLAVFLCSEANTYITGQSILVDGALVGSY